MADTNLGSVYGTLELRDNLDKGMKQAQKTLDKRSKSISDRFKEIEGSFSDAGGRFSVGFTAPIVAGFGLASKESSKFETLMSDISTLISGDSTEAIEELSDGILKLTDTVPKSPEELGAAAYDVLSAGVEGTANQLEVLEQSSRLAVAGIGDTKGAVDIMTSSINAFGLEASDSNKISDILFKTVKNGKTTVDQMSQAFGATAPIIAEAGISLEEFSAATAALTTSGLHASQAQNSLRQATVSLIKPTDDMKKLLEQAGYESGQAALEQDGLVKVMEKVKEAANGDSEALGKAFGSVEALGAATALTGSVNDAFVNTLADMTTGANLVDEAFAKQSETSANASQIIQNKFNKGMIALGSVVLPIVVDLMERLGPVIDWIVDAFKNLSPQIQKGLVIFGAIVAAIGPMLLIFGQIAGAVSSIITLVGTVSSVFAALSGVLLPIIVIIAAIAGAVALAIKYWDQIVAVMTPVINLVKGTFSEAFGSMKESFDKIKTAIAPLLPVLQQLGQFILIVGGIILAVFAGLLVGVINALGPLLSGLFAMIGNLIAGFSYTIQAIIALFRGDFVGAWDYVKLSFSEGIDFFVNLFDTIVGTVSGFVSGIITFFQNLYDVLVGHSIIPDMVNAILEWISKMVTDTINFVSGLVSSVIGFFTNLYNDLTGRVSRFVKSALSFWIHLIASIIARVIGLKNNVVNKFKELVNGVFNKLNDLKNKGIEAINNLKNAIFGQLGNIKDWGANIGQSFIDGIANALGGIGNMVTNALNSAKGMLQGQSPPKEGPFEEIDKWGFNIGDAWVKGMQMAMSRVAPPNVKSSFTSTNAKADYSKVGKKQSETGSGTFNVTIPVQGYMGTQTEILEVAEKFVDAIETLAKQKGVNLDLIGRKTT